MKKTKGQELVEQQAENAWLRSREAVFFGGRSEKERFGVSHTTEKLYRLAGIVGVVDRDSSDPSQRLRGYRPSDGYKLIILKADPKRIERCLNSLDGNDCFVLEEFKQYIDGEFFVSKSLNQNPESRDTARYEIARLQRQTSTTKLAEARLVVYDESGLVSPDSLFLNPEYCKTLGNPRQILFRNRVELINLKERD